MEHETVWNLEWADQSFVVPGNERIMVTGHRPKDIPTAHHNWCKNALKDQLQELGASYAISGMALGADMWWAENALTLNIPVVAAVPCPGQPDRWPDTMRTHWVELLRQCTHRVLVSDVYHRGVFHERNKWMVRNADQVVAVWTGKTSGGTYHAITEARKASLPLTILNPVEQTVTSESSGKLF